MINKELDQKIIAWIETHRPTIMEQWMDLIRIPSVQGPAAPKAPAAPSFVPEDIDTPVAAAAKPTKPADMTDIDEIFSIFKR